MMRVGGEREGRGPRPLLLRLLPTSLLTLAQIRVPDSETLKSDFPYQVELGKGLWRELFRATPQNLVPQCLPDTLMGILG